MDSVRARLELIERWLDRYQPDVVCLQETKVSARQFPRQPFIERGYDMACTDQGGYGGLAMLSRIGLDRVTVGIPGSKAPLNEQRSISATCGSLRIHTIYAPNGRKVGTPHHEIKLAWYQLLRAWIEMDGFDDGQPTLLVGDFNIAPTDLDIWEAHRYRKRNLTSPPERAAFQGLVELGLVDIGRRQWRDQAVYTWWNRRSDFYESDRGWTLDHALCDPATAAEVTRVWVDRAERGREGTSDHAPIVVDF